MKKLLSILMLVMASFIMVSCSSGSTASTMDGEYYGYYESDGTMSDTPYVVVEGETLTWTLYDDPYDFIIDKVNKTLTGGPDGRTVPYFFEEGKLTFNGNSSEMDYYLKDSPAYNKLLGKSKE